MTGTGVDAFTGEGAGRRPYWSSGSYTILEDSTPIDPADATGGFGQLTTVLHDDSDARRHGGKRLDLVDGQGPA